MSTFLPFPIPPSGPANNRPLKVDLEFLCSVIDGLVSVYAPIGATYVTLSTNSSLTSERVLTGTSNQIVVTDNGAGSTVVLSTPQNIHTAATPTFASETLTATSNQLILGTTRTVTITAPTPASSSRTITLPDLAASYSVVGTESAQTINGVKTFGNQLLIANGSDATPGLSPTGDTDTGLYSATGNSLGISVGGSGNNHLEIRQNSQVSISSLNSGRSAFTPLIIDATILTLNAGTSTSIPAATNFYLDGAGDTYLKESSANVVDLYTGGTLALTWNASQDVYTVAYTDYSSTSTVTGWSSTTQKSIYYKKIGKLVWVWFSIDGTSNSTSISFTLPYTVANTVDPGVWVAIRARDNNVDLTTPGNAQVDKNSSTVNCFKDAAGGTWTSSNRKIVSGQFVYQTT